MPEGNPDPNVFAPIAVGDWIFFNGIYVEQGPDPLMALWALEDNIGLYTSPGTQPTYITIVKAQWGIIGNPAGEVGQTRVRYIFLPSSIFKKKIELQLKKSVKDGWFYYRRNPGYSGLRY